MLYYVIQSFDTYVWGDPRRFKFFDAKKTYQSPAVWLSWYSCARLLVLWRMFGTRQNRLHSRYTGIDTKLQNIAATNLKQGCISLDMNASAYRDWSKSDAEQAVPSVKITLCTNLTESVHIWRWETTKVAGMTEIDAGARHCGGGESRGQTLELLHADLGRRNGSNVVVWVHRVARITTGKIREARLRVDGQCRHDLVDHWR